MSGYGRSVNTVGERSAGNPPAAFDGGEVERGRPAHHLPTLPAPFPRGAP